MERESSLTRWGTVLSVGIGALLVLFALGGVLGGEVATTSDSPEDSSADAPSAVQEANDTTTQTDDGTTGTTDDVTTEVDAETDEANNETNETNVTIPVVEAMTAAENETNGTAIGTELTREGDVTDLERPSRVYSVDVLLPNDSHVVANVNATDGSIQQVQRQDDDTGLIEGLFGSEDRLPDDRPDLDSIRSGVEAIELARNDTGENGTVTAVELTSEGDGLRYSIEFVSEEGIQSTVVVAANPEGGGVLTTDPDPDAEE